MNIVSSLNPDIVLNGFALMGTGFEFVPFPDAAAKTVFVMGDFSLKESEVDAVERVILSKGADVTGIKMVSITGQHSHMLEETPKIMFVHFEAIGNLQQIIHLINRAIAETSIRG